MIEWILRIIAVLTWFILTFAAIFLIGFYLIYLMAWALYKIVANIGAIW